MDTVEYIISKLQELNYDVAEANIDNILKNSPIFDNEFIAVEETDSDYTVEGDSPYMYEVSDNYEIAVFVHNYVTAISKAREIKDSILDKIAEMISDNKPFFINRVRREKNSETNVGAYIIEVSYKRNISIT